MKNKLVEWLEKLVFFKEELIDIKSSFFHWMHSLEYKLNIDQVEGHFEKITVSENIISLMRNEMAEVWQSIENEVSDRFDDFQKLMEVYENEMKLLYEWQVKLSADIEIMIDKELRMAT